MGEISEISDFCEQHRDLVSASCIVRQFIIEDIKTYFQIEVCIFLPWQGSGTNRRKASR